MNQTTINPKVFISYSWTTPTHQEWVLQLAERLMSNGVEVIIDKWDLKEGHDKYTFMESMVNSKEIDKVLIILDKKYAEKANERSGGVGTETQIISSKIYSNVSQEKFIPIVSERDEDGNEYLPSYLESRIYIDLSKEQTFESSFEQLLRNLFQRPSYSRPQLGTPPKYLFEDVPALYQTNSILRSFENLISKNPLRTNSLVRDFFDEYFNSLKQFSISFPSRNQVDIGKEIVDSISKYTYLRNDYTAFLEKITKPEIHFNIDILVKFFENLNLLIRPLEDRGSWSNYEFDNFRFIIHELFLYTIAYSLKSENYAIIENIYYSGFILKDKFDRRKEHARFNAFYQQIQSIDTYYKQTYSRNLHNPMAELLINRLPAGLDQNYLTEADLLTYYVAKLNNLSWFPITYIYHPEDKFEIFERLVSVRHIERIKGLFNVENIENLKVLIQEFSAQDFSASYPGAFRKVPSIKQLINVEKIGSIR